MLASVRSAVATFLLPLLLVSATYVVVSEVPEVSYVCRVYPDGFASITVVVSGLQNYLEFPIPAVGEVTEESLVALSGEGDVILAEFNGTHIVTYPLNLTNEVVVTYEARLGEVLDGYVLINFTSHFKTTVILPEGAGLVEFSGEPDVEIVGRTIKLTYVEPQNIVVGFTWLPEGLPQPTETPTETPVGTETLTEIITQTTGPSSPTQSPPTQTPEPSPSGGIEGPVATFPTYLIILPVVGVIAAVTGFLILRRRAGGKPTEVEYLEVPAGGLDDRDKAILKALSDRGSASISELSRVLGLSKSTVWRRVQRLSRDGFIELVDEGRRVILRLTEKGREALG